MYMHGSISLGAESFVSATGAANGSRGELAGIVRENKNIAWSSGSSMSTRSPLSFSSSVKTEISNGEGITSYMHGDKHQLVKDEESKKEEEQQLINGRGNNNGNTNNNNTSGKRRRSPAALMEGSRCSRVNGRGWRCRQQTLVGYSLCEHHLGKGRLRSVTSVRCKKASGGTGGKQLPNQPIRGEQQLHHKQRQSLATVAVEEEEEEKKPKPLVGAWRGKRIGMVKAHSISSLLGQTSLDVVDHAELSRRQVHKRSCQLRLRQVVGFRNQRPVESSTQATAAAAASIPHAAHREGISLVM